MKRILTVGILICLVGCATDTKYLFDVGPRFDQHNERASTPLSQQISTALGQTVTLTAGDDNKIMVQGYGGQIGLTEYHLHNKLVSRISAYFEQFPMQNYTFRLPSGTSISEQLDLSAAGAEGTIGYEFFKLFQPNISFKYEYLMTTASVINGAAITSSSSNGFNFMIGGGLTMNIPLGHMGSILLIGDYRVPLKMPAGTASMESWNAQIAYQFGSINGAGK